MSTHQRTTTITVNEPVDDIAAEEGIEQPGTEAVSVGGAGVLASAREWVCDTATAAGLWPFGHGAGADLVGTPLGIHPHSGQLACYDPLSWFTAGRQRAAQLGILAANGTGKSALAKKIATGLAGQGVPVVVPFDAKNEYADLIHALDGTTLTVDRVGGLDVLDPGGAIATARTHGLAQYVTYELEVRRDRLLAEVVGIHRRRPLAGWEETALAVAASLLPAGATIAELPQVLVDEIDTLANALALSIDRAADLLEALTLDVAALAAGPVGAALTPTEATQPWAVERPVVIDTSRIPEAEATLSAAVMITCWTAARSAVHVERERNGARVFALVLDEVWRATREFPTLASYLGGLLRMDRHEGFIPIIATHSWTDTEQPGGSNILARCAALAIGGLQKQERDLIAHAGLDLGPAELAEIHANTAAERKGRFVLKIHDGPGHLIHTVITQSEKSLLDTNQQWTTAPDQPETRTANDERPRGLDPTRLVGSLEPIIDLATLDTDRNPTTPTTQPPTTQSPCEPASGPGGVCGFFDGIEVAPVERWEVVLDPNPADTWPTEALTLGHHATTTDARAHLNELVDTTTRLALTTPGGHAVMVDLDPGRLRLAHRVTPGRHTPCSCGHPHHAHAPGSHSPAPTA